VGEKPVLTKKKKISKHREGKSPVGRWRWMMGGRWGGMSGQQKIRHVLRLVIRNNHVVSSRGQGGKTGAFDGEFDGAKRYNFNGEKPRPRKLRGNYFFKKP